METPFPSSPLYQSHASRRAKPVELSALARLSLAVMVCLAGVLCAMFCPLHLSAMEISAAQHRIPRSCASAGQRSWCFSKHSGRDQHFHLHNGDTSTATINPLWDIFRPGCAAEGEMTGSLHIQTTQCLSQLQPPGAMGEAWAVSPGKVALTSCCGFGLLGAATGARYHHSSPSELVQLHCF